MNSPIDTEFTRARGYYIYAHGKRFVDLDLCNGRAVWGHTPCAVSNKIKNTLSQGIWGTITTRYIKQFLRTFDKVFPYYEIQGLVFDQHGFHANNGMHTESVRDAFFENKFENKQAKDIDIIDTLAFLFHHTEQDTAMNTKDTMPRGYIWRPYCGISFDDLYNRVHVTPKSCDNIVSPLIPFAWHNSPLFLCKKKGEVHSQGTADTMRATTVSGAVSTRQETVFNFIVSSINPVVLTGLTYSLNLLQKHGMVFRMPPTHTRNRKDILIIDCGNNKDSNSIFPHANNSTDVQRTWHNNKHTQAAMLLPLPNESWKQHGIYISFSVNDMLQYQYIREVFFAHGFYVSSQSLFTYDNNIYAYITLPAFFTTYEMTQWEKSMYILQQNT